MTDDRPVMGLEHLAIPNESGNARWLNLQQEKKEAAIKIVAEAASRYFAIPMPANFYREFAERIVADLDHLV